MKKRIVILLFVFIFLLSFIFSGCSPQQSASSQSRTPEEKALISEIQLLLDHHAENYEFSALALVAKGGKVLFSKGYGFADYANQIKNEPDTIFNVGSITKQFTAAAIMLLQERGLLSVQDTIDKYIPDYPDGNSIKIFNLLNHTTGIKDYVNDVEDNDWGKPHTPEDIIEMFKDKELEFKPGEKFKYSNSNYILLGYIIEKASGLKYEDFIKENIIEPLDMNRTGFGLSRDSFDKIAKGYIETKPKAKEAKFIDASVPYAAGALQTTAEDLLKWDQALYANRLLKEESIKEMFTPYLDNYAYGWYVNDNGVVHGGSIDGYHAYIERNIKKGYTIIILTNSDALNLNIIVPKVDDLLNK